MKIQSIRNWIPLILLFFLSAEAADFQPVTVIVVRHAEKTTKPADDPGLTEQGKERSLKLVKLLQSAGIGRIYSSQYARTRLTAEPLAKELGLQVMQIDADKSETLVSTIVSDSTGGGKVLVVGHSNTLPEIIAALGAGKIPEIEDAEYDNFYIVTVYSPGKATLLRLKF